MCTVRSTFRNLFLAFEVYVGILKNRPLSTDYHQGVGLVGFGPSLTAGFQSPLSKNAELCTLKLRLEWKERKNLRKVHVFFLP